MDKLKGKELKNCKLLKSCGKSTSGLKENNAKKRKSEKRIIKQN